MENRGRQKDRGKRSRNYNNYRKGRSNPDWKRYSVGIVGRKEM
jgi:hypothetical protein